MSHNKLYLLTSTFDDDAWDFIRKAIMSPIFGNSRDNVRQRMATFARYIQQYSADLTTAEQASITEQLIWKKLFPKNKYNDGRMRQERTALTQMIESIIPYLYLHSNAALQTLMRTDYYANYLALHPYFEAQLNVHKQQLSDFAQEYGLDTLYYYYQLRTEELILVYETQKAEHGSDLNLQQTTAAIDNYFIAQKLRFALYIINREPHKDIKKQAFIAGILNHIDNNTEQYKQERTIWVRYKTLLLLNNPKTQAADIREHLELLQQYFALFSKQEQANLYTYILNFVVHQINNYSNYEQLKKCWNLSYELYLNIGIPQNLIYRSSGHLTHEALRNVLVAAINAYETPKQRQQVAQEMQQWLESIAHKILDDDKQIYFKAAQNFCLFMQQQYKQCAYHIYINPLPINVAWLLDMCRLSIKAYYELQSEEQLDIEINNFKTGLHRNSVKHCPITDQQKTLNLNFVKFLLKINRPTTTNNAKRIQEISEDLKNTPDVVDRKWLLDKLDEKK